MGIGGHALLVFVTVLRTHLFLMKFHTFAYFTKNGSSSIQ